jgi:hypothetical protein
MLMSFVAAKVEQKVLQNSSHVKIISFIENAHNGNFEFPVSIFNSLEELLPCMLSSIFDRHCKPPEMAGSNELNFQVYTPPLGKMFLN